MNGIKFAMGLDASQMFGELFKVEGAAKRVGNSFKQAFANKLTQVISIAAIEQAVQRTAQWAAEINNTSKALGVTATQLQTIQHIASKTGTSEDAIVGMFSNIQKARDEAIKGNQQLVMSFQKLGVSMDDLMTSNTTQLFSKVMGGMGSDIRVASMGTRSAAQDIAGTPENVIATFQAGIAQAGGDFNDAVNAMTESGQIASDVDIHVMASLWSQILTELKAAGIQLLPAVIIILGIVKTLVTGLGAVSETLGGLFKIVIGILTVDTDKIAQGVKSLTGLLLNSIFGVVKMVINLFTFIGDFIGKVFSKIPGMSNFGKEMLAGGKILREGAAEGFNDINKFWGIGKGTAERGQAVPEALSMILSPVGNKAIGGGMEEIGSTLGAFREGLGRSLVIRGRGIQKYGLYGDVMGEQAIKQTIMAAGSNSADFFKNLGNLGNIGKQYTLGKNIMSTSAIASFGGPISATAQAKEGIYPRALSPIIPANSPLFNGMPVMGGSAMLRMGGMFGAGDSQLVKLNIKMVELLSQIQQNTNPYGRGIIRPVAGTPMGMSAGGPAH